MSHYDLYLFTGVAFKLQNDHVTFQGTMNVMLSTAKCQHAFVQLENIAIFSCIPKELIKHTELVLQMQKDSGAISSVRTFLSSRI